MDTKEIFRRLIEPTVETPALDAWTQNRDELAKLGAESEALTKSISELQTPIAASENDERELATLQGKMDATRAAILIGEATDDALADVNRKVSAVIARQKARGDKPKIAAIAVT